MSLPAGLVGLLHPELGNGTMGKGALEIHFAAIRSCQPWREGKAIGTALLLPF